MAKNSLTITKSRYNKGGQTVSYPNRLDWWERYVFPISKEDVLYTIESKYNKRPDLLAYDVYGSPVYTWFILQYNNIIDINIEFVTGTMIRLPTVYRVKTEIT
jgi:hypothetical protein